MKEKARAMVLASFVADSLALGAHWIYDTEIIAQKVGLVDRLLAPPEKSYHPTKKRGEFTHYGDQTLILLESVAEKSRFDLEDFGNRWRRFSETTDGYIDHATKDSLLNMSKGKSIRECGSMSTDLGGPARLAPLIYGYRNDLATLLTAAKEQTAMTHTGPGVAEGAEFIVRTAFAVLHGATPGEAIQDAIEQGIANIDLDLRIRKAVESIGRNSGTVIKEFGQMCAINAALPGAVHLILQYADNLREALVENVMAGGDSAARGLVVGIVLGAAGGLAALPENWIGELAALQAIEHALEIIL